MKKIILITVFICTLVSSISANSLYIKAITVNDREALFGVQYDLDELGYKMNITESHNQYIAYVGPFENMDEANIALSRIRKNISRDAYVLVLDIRNGKVVPSKIVSKKVVKKTTVVPSKKEPIIIQKNEEIKEKIDSPQIEESTSISSASEEEIVEPVSDNMESCIEDTTMIPESQISYDFFVGLTLGVSKLDVSTKNVYGNVPFSIDYSGINYGLEAGYNFNKNIFMTINYQRLDLDDININNVFSSVNYRFNEMYSTFPYMGIIAGYSMLSWKNNPANVTSTEASYSLFGGLQFGSDVPIGDDMSIYVFYRYMMLNHTASVKTSSAKKDIEYSGEHDFNIGIKYSF